MIKSNFVTKLIGILFITFPLLFFVSSCEHEEAMDTGVGPIQPGSVDSIARFSWIQANIFDQYCALSGCHVGGSSPHGLDLSVGNAYGNLVDVPAQGPQTYSILRVKPGVPDSSYLVWKLENRIEIVGQRMPHPSRFQDPLTTQEIDAIKRWIQGATFNKKDREKN